MKKKLLVCLMFTILFLSACSIKEKEDVNNPTNTEENVIDWRSQDFKITDRVTTNQTIWANQFSLIDTSEILDSQDAIWQRIYLGQREDSVYYLYGVWSLEKQITTYYCVGYNMVNNSVDALNSFTISELGYDSYDNIVYGGAITKDGLLFLDLELYSRDANEEIIRNRVWAYISENKVVNDVYITEFVKENDLFISMGYIGNGESQVYVADNGVVYYLPINNWGKVDHVYAFDEAGNMLAEYKTSMNSTVCRPIRTDDGDYIIAIAYDDEKRMALFYYDTENNVFKNKAYIEDCNIVNSVGMHNQTIYYITSNKIISWDIVSGERNECYKLSEMGTFNLQSFSICWVGQKMYWGFRDDAGEWVASTSDSELNNDNSIVVADLYGDAKRLKLAVTSSKMKNRNMGISYTSAKSEADKTRIYAELATGDGPDVMLISREEMYNLVSKGLLANMEDVIGVDNKNGLINGAITAGSVDGVFYGVPQGIYLTSLRVYNDAVTGDTWTYQQFIDAVYSGKVYPGINIGESLCSSQVSFIILTQLNLMDSFFVDIEKNRSRFKSDEVKAFIEALGDMQLINMYDSKVDAKSLYFSGSIDAQSISNFKELNANDDYIDYMDYIEKSGYKYIGYPTSGGNGNYLYDEGVIVVNANSLHKAEVRQLIECFLSDDVQSRVFHEDEYISVTGYGIEDFIPFLENCVPIPAGNNVIREIVFEEIALYFSHEKTLDQVLEIIDSRVQLYLDEQ